MSWPDSTGHDDREIGPPEFGTWTDWRFHEQYGQYYRQRATGNGQTQTEWQSQVQMQARPSPRIADPSSELESRFEGLHVTEPSVHNPGASYFGSSAGTAPQSLTGQTSYSSQSQFNRSEDAYHRRYARSSQVLQGEEGENEEGGEEEDEETDQPRQSPYAYAPQQISYYGQTLVGSSSHEAQAGYAATQQDYQAESSREGQPSYQNTANQRHLRVHDGLPSGNLDPSYKRVSSKSIEAFFRPGRVFSVLWTEPAGSRGDDGEFSVVNFREQVYAQIRRFIVIKPYKTNSICVPILTYGKRGVVGRPDAPHHAIAYNSNSTPTPLVGEILNRHAIKIEPRNGETLHPASRIDFSKAYTIEHNVKVKSIGSVAADYIEWLRYYFQESNSINRDEEGEGEGEDEEEEEEKY